MDFWKRAKEHLKQDIQKAVDAANTKEIQLMFLGGLPGVKGKTIRITKNVKTGETKIGGRAFRIIHIQCQDHGSGGFGAGESGALAGGFGAGSGAITRGGWMGPGSRKTATVVIHVSSEDKMFTVFVLCNEEEYDRLCEFAK